MKLPAGTRLGAYEVVAPLGAGGMGEVYRARDTRLGREAALKVLPAALSQDASRLKRFEKEARAASALNHPNIVTIYEIGLEDGISYIAMELVSGKTLREMLLAGPLPIKRLLAITAPLAEGLAVAHEAGIVHRDLKPENVMVTKDSVVKILDFGLAKLMTGIGSGEESLPTVTRTEPGALMGTVSYMSPEQAAGQPADFRSDQFSLGVILHEMGTGKKAFSRGTSVDTLSAILHEEPDPLEKARPDAPAPLCWLVERCLAKDPAHRYAATRDLARDLESLRHRSSSAPAVGPVPRRRRWTRWAALAAAALALVLAGALLRPRSPAPTAPRFQRLTFGRGIVHGARFTPDGQNVVYSAAWRGEPWKIFLTRPGGSESLPLALPPGTTLLAVSPAGELAVSLSKGSSPRVLAPAGVLAVAPLSGGAPRELAEDVIAADWSPTGREMAVRRGDNLEYPLGKVLYKGVDVPRVSPRGDRIAFGWSDPDDLRERNDPTVSVVDLAGKRTDIGHGQRNQAMVWTPDGREVWFTSGSGWGNADTIVAASLDAKSRVVTRLPGAFISLNDFSRDGRLLLVTGTVRGEVWCRPAGTTTEKELGWFSVSTATAISADGKTVLLNEVGEGGGFGTSYLRGMDGSPAVKILEGSADALSADAKWVIGIRSDHLLLVPVGPGETRKLQSPLLKRYGMRVAFFPDGRRIAFDAQGQDGVGDLWVQDLAGGEPRKLPGAHPDGGALAISPDGKALITSSDDGPWIYPTDGGDRRRIKGLRPDEIVACWAEDSRSVFVFRDELPYPVERLDVETGARRPFMTIGPSDQSAIYSTTLLMSPNGAYALNVGRYLSDLFLVEGLYPPSR
jgi:Tol biopolymer transport system component